MGKLLANQIRGINPLAKKGVLLLLAFLLSFACVVGVKDAAAAPTTTGGNAWTSLHAATAAALSINVTSATALTPGTGANRLLLVAVHLEKATGTSDITLDATPTFGGVALVPLANTFANTAARVHTWMGYLPEGLIPTGAQTVNFRATSTVGNFSGIQIKAAVYTGVDQSTPISAAVTNYAAATTVALPTGGLSYTADSVSIFATCNGGTPATTTFATTGGSAFALATGANSTTGGFSGYVAVSGTNASAGTYTTATQVTYGGTTSTRSTVIAASLKAYVSSSDVTKPVVTSFTVPSSSTSTTITGITMTATDDTGVTGYGITESATPPLPSLLTSATPLTSYTASGAGTKTLYAWAKDAAGNVSNVYTSQSCTITLPPKPTRTANWTSQYGAVAYPAGTVSNYTVAAGSNRLLVVAIAATSTAVGAQSVTNVTWGGKPLTLAAGNGTLATIWNHSYIYYLNEADIASASGTALTATITGGTAYYTRIYAAVYTGVDQTNPVSSAALYENATANTTVGPFSPALAVGASEQAVQIVNLARSTVGTTGRTISGWATGWTTAGQAPTGIVTSGPCQQVYIRDRAVPTSAVNDGSQHTASGNTFDSYAAISIKAASSGLTVTTGSTIPAKNVYAGDTSVAVDAFNVSAAAADTITSITVTGSATTTSANVSAVSVYRKVGADSTKYETGDLLVASGTFTGNVATMTPSGNNTFTAGSATNFIVVYDIASGAAPDVTLTGNVTAMTATSMSSLVDPLTESAILTIHATTTIGNGVSEPAYVRLYKNSVVMLDAFTLKHNGTATNDDTISNVTVTLAPAGVSGSGPTLSKIGMLEVVNEAGTVVYGSLTAATTGDTWNVSTPALVATATETNYYLRITTAANIVPGYYSVSGTITSVVHSKPLNKLVNLDTSSATHNIDTELPLGPTVFTATTPPDAALIDGGGGKINLTWDAASDPSSGSLHATLPYILKRSAAGGVDPEPYCTNGTTAFEGNALNFNDSGLNDTQGPIYHYRVCARDAQGNVSSGIATSASPSYTNYCDMTPALTLGEEDPLNPGTIQNQLVKSEGGNPFLLQVINNDIGTCPNVTFNIALVETSTTGGSGTAPPPSTADFSTTFPASVLLGKTAGPGGTNKTSETVSIYIHGLATADQIQKFIFKAQVSAAGHGSATSPFATAILNDMPPIVHNSNNMGKYQYGVWGNEYTCATCHSNSTTNIKGVFEVISTPIGKRNVLFNTISGNSLTTGGYSNDQRVNKDGSNNVCSVCHHRTRQHQYSASKLFGGPANDAPYTTDHHNNRDCVKCHTHNTAFRSILGVCGDCHGFKGTDYSPVSKATMVKVQTNALGTSPPSYGAHMAHNYAEMSCAVCHNNTNHGLASDVWLGDDKIEMGFNVTDSTFPGFNPATPVVGGTFEGTTNLNFPYTWVAGPATTINQVADYNASCNTYCHGGWTGNVGSNTKPNWVGTGQAACGTCHNATLVTPPLSGSHPTHAGTGATGLGKDCKICHGTYTQAQYTGSKHINGNVQWDLSAISAVAQYNGSNAGSTGALATDNAANYATCTNMYCHSNVQGVGGVGAPTTYAVPLWGDNGVDSGTVFCGSCHIYPNTVGGHAQHESAEAGVDFDCHVCHNNGGRTSPLSHANQKIDFEFSGLGTNTVYSKGNSVTPGLGYGSCSTSDCHGRYTRTWGPPTALPFCDKCHGSATSARGFYNTKGPDGTLSIYSAAIGMHDIHLQNPNSPRKATFSRFTSFAAAMSCRQCHYTPQGPFTAGHVDNALPAEVPFAHISSIAHNGDSFGYYSSPTYSFATQNCSNVWCHGAGMQSNTSKGAYVGTTPAITRTNPVWNTPFLATGNACTKCHAMPPPAPNSSYTHYNVGAGRPYILSECVGCHQSLNTTATGFVNKSLHINGRIDGGCTGCHGNPPISTGIGTADGLATPAQNALLQGGPGAHQAHFNNVNIANNCYTCHNNYNPVMTSDGSGLLEISFNSFGVTAGTFTGYTNSVNGPKWLVNATLVKVNNTTGQEANVCSNLYCHGSTITGGTLKTPNWELADQAICGTCHGGDNTSVPFPAQTGAHSRHASVNVTGGKVGLGLACESCHGVSAASMAHVNGAVTWNLDQANAKIGTTATYKTAPTGTTGAVAPSASYGTCANFYCHSNVQGAGGIGVPTNYQTMTWGSSPTLTCSSCHLSQVGTGTASHAAHTALYGGSVSCGYCHHNAGANTEEHANGMIYVNVTTSRVGVGVYTGSNRVAGSAGGYGSCSNVICHGAATLTWGANLGANQCQKCHGSKSAAFLTVTSAQVAPGYGTDGIATDGTTVASARRVGAHQRHLTTGVLSTNVKCSECHVKVNNILDSGHLNYTTATLTFSGRATGNGHTTAATSRDGSFTITCSNLWCHTGKANSGSTPAPVWTTTGMINETTLSVASCNVCHGFPPKSVGAGGTALAFDHTNITTPTGFPVTTCTSCHTNLSQTGTTYDDIFTLKSQHLNGSIEAIMNCASCHDYDVNGATWGGVKNANYAGNNQGIGAHYKHIVYLKAKYSVTLANNDTWASLGFIRVCGTCHSITEGTDHSTATPTNPRSITFGDNATNPRNFGGTPLYNGNSATSSSTNPKTCSNTDCHYKTSPVWSTY